MTKAFIYSFLAVALVAVIAVGLRCARAARSAKAAVLDEHAIEYDGVGSFQSDLVDPPFWDKV